MCDLLVDIRHQRVKILINIFARHGYPEEIVLDNGPQFFSEEFTRFFSSIRIEDVHSSTYFPISNGKSERFHRYLKKSFQAVTVEGGSRQGELPKILMLYSSILHPMTGKTLASLLFRSDMRTELTSIKLNASESSSNVKERKKSYQTPMKSYHDRKHRAKTYHFAIGDVVYLDWSKSDRNNKLKSRLNMVKYVIMEFLGRDTYKLVRTLYGKVSGRNAKFLTRSCPAIMAQALIFDDI